MLMFVLINALPRAGTTPSCALREEVGRAAIDSAESTPQAQHKAAVLCTPCSTYLYRSYPAALALPRVGKRAVSDSFLTSKRKSLMVNMKCVEGDGRDNKARYDV